MELTRRQFLARVLGTGAGVIAAGGVGWDEAKILKGWEDLPEDGFGPVVAIRPDTWMRVTAVVSKGQTSIHVDACGYSQPDDLLIVPRTNEFMRIATVHEGHELVVIRAVSGSKAFALNAGDWVYRPF